ncbi:ATPase [Aureococcus anophagefferens]|nr:ATPase [Aureococcus anophagefferens]
MEEAQPLLDGKEALGDLVAEDVGVRANSVQILKNITCTWRCGQLSAIMGGSGAGKTTLLTCLIGDLAEECVQGKVGFGAAALTVAERRRCGAVPQDDIMPTTLSPRMILTFAAALKGVKDIDGRVNALLRDLGLEGCADTIVGEFGEGVGISGGQRKRCSIGMELVDEAGSILCCDEPTSGLDSSLTESIVDVLSGVAKGLSCAKAGGDVEGGKAAPFGRRKVVVATIHQPSWTTIAKFDCLTLLAAAATSLYNGGASSPVGWPYPMDNPIDEIMRRVKTEDGARHAVAAWKGRNKAASSASILRAPEPGAVPPDAYGASARVRVFVMRPVVAVIFGAIFWQIGENMARADAPVVLGLACIVMMNTALQAMGATVLQVPRMKALIRREHRNGLYGVGPWFAAFASSTLILDFIGLIPFTAIIYPMGHLAGHPRNVLIFFIAVYACVVNSSMIGVAGGAMCKDFVTVIQMYMPVTFLQILLMGFLIPKSDLPPALLPLYYANPIQYAFSILAINELHGVTFSDGDDCDAIDDSLDDEDMTTDFFCILAILGGFTAMAFLSLRAAVKECQTANAEKAEAYAVPCDETCKAYCGAPGASSTMTVLPSDYNPIRPSASAGKLAGRSISSPDMLRDVAVARELAPDLSALEVDVAVSSATVREKVVLQGVTATWKGGKCGAVMGGSGAGKSTLMTSLIGDVGATTGRRVAAGRITLGHARAPPAARRASSCLVPQDDVMFESLTPRQILTFAGRLRGIDAGAIDDEVEDKLALLSLAKCADTKIFESSSGRGVSGGERKRCSIGMELIRPEGQRGARFAVLAADEPTTGLDSARAEEVTGTLRRVAKATGAVVVATIHQPSMRILELSFDTITLLQTGRLVYHGPVSSIVDYFSANLSWAPAANENPVDTYMNLLRLEPEGRAEDGHGRRRVARVLLPAVPANCADAASNPYTIFAFLAVRFVLGVAFGCFWWRDGRTPIHAADTATLNSLFFLTLTCASGSAMVQTIIFVPDMKNLLRREVQNGLFAFGPWVASQILFMTIFHGLGAFCLVVPEVYLIDARANFFGRYVLCVFLGPLMFMFLGLFVGALERSSDFEPSRQKCVSLLTFMVLFCGLIIPYPELQQWCRPIYKADPFSKLYNAVLIAFWRGIDFDADCADDRQRGICYNTGAEYLQSSTSTRTSTSRTSSPSSSPSASSPPAPSSASTALATERA